MTDVRLYLGDCLEILKEIPTGSISAVVTDPPYGISFMQFKWDYNVPSVGIWRECLRVLKPGGHLLSFAGTRTQHRMTVNIEDAGFEIRDMIAWVYGSGFPKSKNLGNGFGSALKPALEPITVARKPFSGTVAANVLEHGTGGLNIDACRVETDGNDDYGRSAANANGTVNAHNGFDGKAFKINERNGEYAHAQGRFPANLIHDGSKEVTGLFPVTGNSYRPSGAKNTGKTMNNKIYGGGFISDSNDGFNDTGSAARFFYCAKSSRRDRDEGLEGMEPRDKYGPAGQWNSHDCFSGETGDEAWLAKHPNLPKRNFHPTVKPTSLMRYLCRLVTPPGGVVLDPFMGSGSTGKAAMLEGFGFVGIDTEAEYVEIARRRIAYAQAQMQLPLLELAP